MIGSSLKALNALIHGRDVMGKRSTPTSLGPLLSSRFLTLGRRRIQVGTVIRVRDEVTLDVIREMTVVVVLDKVDGMTVVTQDKTTGMVAVTVIKVEEETILGRVINGEAGTLVGAEIAEMAETIYPSSH
jgi:hypothetical protein